MCGRASCAKSGPFLVESLVQGGRRIRKLRNAEKRCKSTASTRSALPGLRCSVAKPALSASGGVREPAEFRYGGMLMTESQLWGFTPHTSAIMEYDASRAS